MRQPLRRMAGPHATRSQPITIPAPYGGINGVDAIVGGMDPTDAIDLRNFVCIDGGVETRDGYTVRHTLQAGTPVRYLQPLPDPAAGSLAACGGCLFLVDSGVTQIAYGFLSDDWRSAILNGRVFLVNGADAPRDLNGAAVTLTAWSGPTYLSSLCRVRAHAKRLFFAEKASARFWYTESPGNVSGKLLPFDLSGVGNRGGFIEDIATLAPDGGMGGDDDAIVFFMSSGEAIVYRGSNPGDAANWGRVGVFPVGRPLAVQSYGGDVLTASADGYAELSRVLPSGRSDVAGFGAKIARIARAAAANFGGVPGWQILYSPARQITIVHVPQTANSSQQHIRAAGTGAWSRWTDLPATVWGHVRETLCFGTHDGRICVYGGAGDDGVAIVATAQAAWNPLGAPGRKKRIGLVKPIVTADFTPMVQHVIGVDFKPPTNGAAANLAAPANIGVWNESSSIWNAVVWGGAERVTAEFRGGGAMGEWFAMGLRVDTTAGRVKWLATTLMVEAGT